jgi:hypothetical protein
VPERRHVLECDLGRSKKRQCHHQRRRQHPRLRAQARARSRRLPLRRGTTAPS